MKCGIYKITAPSGNFYIGSSCDIGRRWADHRRMLSRGAHHCVPLQLASIKYGFAALRFEIVEECPPEQNLVRELHYISTLNPKYNLARVPGKTTRGLKHSMEAREKMSASRSGEKHHNFGKKLSDETRQKMRESRTGRKHSEETLQKIRESNKRVNLGRKLSPETIKKMKESKKKFADEDYTQMLALYEGGMTQVALASHYGMVQSSIGRHLKIAKKKFDSAE